MEISSPTRLVFFRQLTVFPLEYFLIVLDQVRARDHDHDPVVVVLVEDVLDGAEIRN